MDRMVVRIRVSTSSEGLVIRICLGFGVWLVCWLGKVCFLFGYLVDMFVCVGGYGDNGCKDIGGIHRNGLIKW